MKKLNPLLPLSFFFELFQKSYILSIYYCYYWQNFNQKRGNKLFYSIICNVALELPNVIVYCVHYGASRILSGRSIGLLTETLPKVFLRNFGGYFGKRMPFQKGLVRSCKNNCVKFTGSIKKLKKFLTILMVFENEFNQRFDY